MSRDTYRDLLGCHDWDADLSVDRRAASDERDIDTIRSIQPELQDDYEAAVAYARGGCAKPDWWPV